ncbi:adenosylmethionine decarboxylase [Chitinimonas sp.]|uniref:adenosylmethionine decarboxylase n=1 Tax=Chitinimonas sp. TaxID=1934313 RepID=UPI0035B4AA1A
MNGLHLTADLHGCRRAHWLTDQPALATLCRHAVASAGLCCVAEQWHRFPASAQGAGGITGVLLLAESHLAIHTWPERAAVTLDVYVCNFGRDNSQAAEALLAGLLAEFAPESQHIQRLQRGAAC